MAENEPIYPRPSGSGYAQPVAKRIPLRLLDTPAGWGEEWATKRLQRAEPSLLHVRIPAFAAAMVVRLDADLRDQSLIVGHNINLGGRGTVLAASPAASAEGVLAGMTLRAAEKLCPAAQVLAVDPLALERAAQEVLAILGRYTPIVEPEWQTAATDRGTQGGATSRRNRNTAQPRTEQEEPMRQDFYAPALTQDDLILYQQAQAGQGLQGEIALVRLRLYHLLHNIANKQSEDQAYTGQIVRLVDLLIKALRAQGAGAGDEEQALLERALEEEARRILAPIQK